MKILILSFYYPPDIGPGALRAESLVNALLEREDEHLEIDVLTTVPNRYNKFIPNVFSTLNNESVSIRRFDLPKHQSGIYDQSRAFVSYALEVNKATRNKKYDLVFATSSRLMTAALGAWIAKRVRSKLYLDIRDLFTDTMEDVMAQSYLRFLFPMFKALEAWTLKSSDAINVVSAGFLPHVQKFLPKALPTELTNGIDNEFLTEDFSSNGDSRIPLVVYAGNMGEGQGLHHILPAVAAEIDGKILFRLIGDGARRKILQETVESRKAENIEILDPVPRIELLAHYRDADILFLHLNDHKAFHKVLPSKIFEYAATGKPILAGVSGFAADFLNENIPGVEVFTPCDSNGMIVGLLRLLSGPKKIDRKQFCEKFNRQKIMREMAEDFIRLVDKK